MTAALRLLIVDDEPVVRDTLASALEGKAWLVEAADSAEAALEVVAARSFDLLLVDKNLPGMSGIALVKKLREHDADTRVILMTGFASADSALEALRLGIDAYIEKPFVNVMHVVAKIEDVVRAHARRRQSGSVLAARSHFQRAREALRAAAAGSGVRVDVVVISPNQDDRAWISQQFGPGAEVAQEEVTRAGIDRLRQGAASVVVIDAGVRDPPLIDAIRTIRQLCPDEAVIVIAMQKLALRVLEQLIELGVRVVLDKPLDAAVFQEKLDEIR